ncbi:peptidoglycan-binding domain-containing protein [Streptomyces sp. HUAS ZL42]|uniref:peptidoglycan-binding domain-containing protein n=1 Tax=Streptomyces sp. HUAS ZL42 TaxID=3231715 RepID=UPI00345E533E
MNEPKGSGRGYECPQCGALRAPDNTPSCACTERASEALRDARTAEAAAAEDFDPLRIRPYVELEGAGMEGTAPAEPSAAEDTMPLHAITPALPTPLVPRETEPSATDLSLFETGGGVPGTPAPPSAEDRPGGRRRTVLLALAAACVAVVAAAGYASGLFSYETPSREGALPDDVRAAVPDTSTSAAPVSSSQAGATTSGPASAPPSSASSSHSTGPSSSASSASPSASRSTEPTETATTVRATGTIEPENGAGDAQKTSAAPVLRRGDKGAEVTELELRLTQLGLYTRQPGGKYNEGVEDAVTGYQQARGIQDEEPGVYGAATRTRLESETTEP